MWNKNFTLILTLHSSFPTCSKDHFNAFLAMVFWSGQNLAHRVRDYPLLLYGLPGSNYSSDLQPGSKCGKSFLLCNCEDCSDLQSRKSAAVLF